MESNNNTGLHGSKKFITIFVLSLGLMIIVLDSTLLNVSLSAIIKDFKTDIQSIQWVITIYSLTLAALTITGGRIGDLFGRKRMFVVGAIIFALGSLIASISQNIPTMIIGESIIEGMGAALMMPATASLLVSNFTGKDRKMAFGIWGGVAGAAAALGPVVGGFLTTNYSWRWGFRINILIAIILCVGSIVIPESKDREEKSVIDWIGVLLSSTGLLSFVFGIIESEQYGWWKAKEIFSIGNSSFTFPYDLSIVPFAITLGIILITLFIIWETHLTSKFKTPLVSMKLFSNKQYVSGITTTFAMSLGQAGLFFVLPVFMQSVRGFDALQTGVALLPMPLTLLVVAPLAAILSNKISYKLLIQVGLLINIFAMIVLHQSIGVDSTATNLAPGLILFGLGMGLVMSQINNITLSAVSVEEAGEASGVNNTLRQVGSSFGSALIGAVLIGTLSANLTNGINDSKVLPRELKSQISTNISKQNSNIEFGNGAEVGKNVPKVIKDEIANISHNAVVDSDKQSLILSIGFALLGFLASFLIPNMKNVEKNESLAAKR